MRAELIWITAVCLCWIGLARADDASAPTTRPQPAAAQPTFERPGIQFLRNVRISLAKVELSDDQRTRIGALVIELQSKTEVLRQQAANGKVVRDDLRKTIDDFRSSLFDILTPEQGQKFRDSMQELMAANPPPSGPIGRGAPQSVIPSTKPKSVAADPSATQPSGAAIGDAAPEFHLLTPASGDIKSTNFKGRIVVMEFGSLSAPSFRDHVMDLQRLASRYSGQVYFLIVYTREQHPKGGWESQRNQDDGISVDQPADMQARMNQAKEARVKLSITLPMGVDGMDDATANAFGGFPNAAVVIGRDGKIVGRQQWTDPSGLGRMIESAIAAK